MHEMKTCKIKEETQTITKREEEEEEKTEEKHTNQSDGWVRTRASTQSESIALAQRERVTRQPHHALPRPPVAIKTWALIMWGVRVKRRE
jgi:hypothetical protein